jgi:hypothetical protein
MSSNKNWLPLDYARGRSLGFTRGRGKGKKGVMGLKPKGAEIIIKIKIINLLIL